MVRFGSVDHFHSRGRSPMLGLRQGCALGVLALASAAFPQAAQAQNQCGAPQDGTVTCSPDNNPYNTGIQYAPVEDLTIVLDSNVVVAPDGTTSGVVLQGNVQGAVTAQTGATINSNGSGIFVNTAGTTVDNGATITAGTRGIGAYSNNDVTVTNTGAITVDGDRSGANFASAIAAGSDVGPVSVTNSGAITLSGSDFFSNGVIAQTYNGASAIEIVNSGDIALATTGVDGFSNAIFAGAYANGEGSTAITNSGDLTVTSANTARGIAVFNYNDGGVVIDNSGDIDVTGANAHGIIVDSRGSALPSDVSISSSGDISATSTTGGFAAGVRAITSGSLAIDVANITATGNATQGIFGRADGDITVAADTVSTSGDNSNAVDLASYSGAIDLAVGDVSTSGSLSGGVRAIGGTDSDVIVTTGNVATTGTAGSNYSFLPTSTAIVATAQGTGDVTVDSGDLSTAGLGAAGLNASAADGDVLASAGDIVTTGGRANGATVQSYTGNVSISTGSVATSGDGSAGIYAVARNGGAAVDANGAISTEGFGARGINVIAGEGGADVNFTEVTATGGLASGISAVSTGGDVTLSGADISSQGQGGTALYAASDSGNVVLNTTGTVSTSGRGGVGIVAQSDTGNTFVTANNVIVAAADEGDLETTRGGILASGANTTVTVTGTATTTGSALYGGTADAVNATATNGDAMVSVVDVNTSGDNADGVDVTSATGMTTVNATGTITTAGDNSRGIIARGETGVTVTGSGDVNTAGDYANAVDVASNNGPLEITVGDISTTGEFSNGVLAAGGTDSDVVVTTGSVSTVGVEGGNYSFSPNSSAIVATAQATGNVTVTSGDLSTAGLSAVGVSANAFDGDVSVATGDVTTTGNRANGVSAQSYNGSVAVSTGTVSTTGDQSAGVYAVARNGGVTVDAGAIDTTGFAANGITAVGGEGGADVTFTQVSTAGQLTTGVSAYAAGGDVSVSGADITSTGQASTALYASSDSGDVSVSSTGSILASGRGGSGIIAVSDTGDVTVAANNVSTVAALDDDVDSARAAIIATGANASVITTGSVNTSGQALYGGFGDAIRVTGTDGNASATVNNVLASGDGSSAVVVTATEAASATVNGRVLAQGDGTDALYVTGDTAAVTVASGGSVQASDGNSITLDSITGSTLSNAGTIANNANGIAVLALGGPIAITNSGRLTSDIVLTDGADSVNNSGTFVVGVNPDFGAGTDSFVNSGTVLVGNGATAAVSPTFTGLESFTNAGGLVDLRNGRAGDTLTLTGSFTGTGNSQLGLDIAFGDTNDQLIIGGAASGNTTIVLNSLDDNLFSFGNGGTLVDVGAASNASAFSLANGSQEQGLVRLEVVYDAANSRYDLVGAPSDAAFRTLNYVEGVRNLWLQSADVISAQLRARRDALWGFGGGDASARTWVQIHGAVDTREDNRDVTDFSRTRTLSSGFQQDYFGGQLGIDFGGSSGEKGGFAFGVTGGYLNSSQNFAGSADRIRYDAVNAGLYASYSSGNFFFNALGKYDYYWGDVNGQSAGFSRDVKGDAYGGRAEAGIRFGSDTLFIEPAASISYVKSDFDSFDVGPTRVDFDDDDGLRGRAGGRIGGQFGLAGATKGSFYVGANYVHEFSGEDGVTFTNNGQSFSFVNNSINDYGEAIVGLSIGSADGISGFFEGNYRRSFKDSNGVTDLEGAGGRAGLRIRF
ncbi:beta strand repeat-containing protein [Novosphingopyxis sp.]|uniref:beta strand repeat-containing protein n=1 Tax=Novosphingopyxis sp. TaxID=2709690 RepID=UPI003B5A9728